VSEDDPTLQGVIPAPPAETLRWSAQLLPIMVLMLVGLTVFFMAASIFQLQSLNEAIEDAPVLNLAPLLSGDGTSETVRLKSYIALEANLIERRHHEANVALMARIWTRYMGFITGMTLAMVGAAFVLGRLSGGGTLSGGLGNAKMNLQTASPGLFMTALGTALMIITITNHPRINLVDQAVYLAPMKGVTQSVENKAGVSETQKSGLPSLEDWAPKEAGD